MSERDWQKDWELAMRATPGPWGYDYDFTTEPINAYIHMKEDGKCVGLAIAKVFRGARERCNDTEFIAEAREALPYWLQRVRELEEAIRNFLRAYKLAEETGVRLSITPTMWEAFEELRKAYTGRSKTTDGGGKNQG